MTFEWFTSDTHFSHSRIIEYCDRPFANIQEMNRALVDNFNSNVSRWDNVLWLGDVFCCDRETSKTMLAQLNGRHFLVLGNHDKSARVMTDIGFVAAINSLVMSIDGRKVMAIHNPEHAERVFGLAHKSRSDEFIMHGHTHAPHVREGNRLHVGVDAWNYAPVSVDAIRKLMRERE